MAEEAKRCAETQKLFNHESTQRFLDFDESFVKRLDQVSSQLDRLKISSQKSGTSRSSLASNVSRILELIPSSPALASVTESEDEIPHSYVGYASLPGSAIVKTKLDPVELVQRPSRTPMEWCCDILPGIEAAFSANGSICLYCGDKVDQTLTE